MIFIALIEAIFQSVVIFYLTFYIGVYSLSRDGDPLDYY